MVEGTTEDAFAGRSDRIASPAMASYAFTTLGCRLNQAESDSMSEELARAGMSENRERPDVVVVNTCTVTREATKASRSAIRRAVRNNPDAKVVVVGCYAVSDPDEVAAIEGVDVILDNNDKERFVDALGQSAPTAALLQIAMLNPRDPLGSSPANGASGPPPVPRVRANLKVQTGCDEWCTFCIIPTTRGGLRSFDPDELVAEARTKVGAGARELVLTGVHLGKYSYDKGGDERELISLMRSLLGLDGVLRLRLSSIFPRHLTDEMLDFMASEPRVCRHLHVPLQAGADGVLEDMHRPYRIEEYVDSVRRAQNALPGLALATDIIVGFPGETDDDFESTLEVVRLLRFSKLHVFRYSPRPDTPAANMVDQVGAETKKARSKRLIDLGNELRAEFLAAHLDTPVEVLVEDVRDFDGITVCSGQTDDYVRVWFEDEAPLGSMVEVRGTRVRADGLEGSLLTKVR
ncbi:MAG: tRNA (N(6)-L-threonylcarbamoyladenosine(37)-C(2))-methylthiotransferase MtaB [Actinomycetota bacterium]|nr:tRNA (N(6)-L-threonylcarbamoyladenosine(37)-C(2))-methylthiotransferase MtaB [Actinomycetota bacterium]